MRASHGFTVIEVLVVMGVMSILAAIAAPRYVDVRQRAFVAAMQSDLNQLRLAQETHRRGPTGAYSPSVGGLGDLFAPSPGVTATVTGATNDFWAGEAAHPGTDQVCTYSTDDRVILCGSPGPGTGKK